MVTESKKRIATKMIKFTAEFCVRADKADEFKHDLENHSSEMFDIPGMITTSSAEIEDCPQECAGLEWLDQ